MYKIKNIIDATAKAYYLAYCALIREHNEFCSVSNHSFSVYVFPAITTAAFSCEIALKNLIYSETGREVKGHNLNKLFKQLSVDKQSYYMDVTINLYNMRSEYQKHDARIDENRFEQLLLICSNNYIDFRYLYEGGKKTDLDFLEAFMFAINDCQNEYAGFIRNNRKT